MKITVLLLLLFIFCIVINTKAQNKLDSTGNVGIGTRIPTEKLEIYSYGLSNILLTHFSDVLGIVGALKFNMAGTDLGRIEVERTIASGRKSDMKFFVRGDSVLEGMRISHNGYVGIGEKSPVAKLHVAAPQGTIFARFTQTNIPAVNASLSISNASSSAGSYIPNVIGRSYMPGRSFGIYITGEAEDVLPASDASIGSIILDGKNKTGAKLINNNVLAINSGGQNLMLVKANGSVGIGTTDTKGYKLAVNGSGIFTNLKVKEYVNWPDFVFKPDYQLPSLLKIEQYISLYQHLPDIPSASEVEKDGIDLGEMNKKLLQKIEEQTLYIIEINKKVESLTSEMQAHGWH